MASSRPTSQIRLAEPLTLFAPAKLNLGLEILGRRPDGYHELVTILQSISLFDRIDLFPAAEPRFVPSPGIPA
ncbi:MAG: hypothetical protein IRY97_01640, partial [Thermomicrobiaceae bacterium]|nr:hypothetical protein [Thermomicrobiaceae bacterium]